MAIPDKKLAADIKAGPTMNGVVLTRPDNTIVDAVGFNDAGRNPCGFGDPLPGFTFSDNQPRVLYGRIDHCVDTYDNLANFTLLDPDVDELFNSESAPVECDSPCQPSDLSAGIMCCDGIRLPPILDFYIKGLGQCCIPDEFPATPNQKLYWDARRQRWRSVREDVILADCPPASTEDLLHPELGVEFWCEGTGFKIRFHGCDNSVDIVPTVVCSPFKATTSIKPFACCYDVRGGASMMVVPPPGFGACSLDYRMPYVLTASVDGDPGNTGEPADNCACLLGTFQLAWEPLNNRWFGQKTWEPLEEPSCSPAPSMSVEIKCTAQGFQITVGLCGQDATQLFTDVVPICSRRPLESFLFLVTAGVGNCCGGLGGSFLLTLN